MPDPTCRGHFERDEVTAKRAEDLRYFLVSRMIAFFATIGMFAATPMGTVKVEEDRVVAIPGVDSPVVEPHLSINPRDPNNVIAGAMVAHPNHGYRIIGVSSYDGGRTWEKHDFGGTDGGDVWTAFLADGTAILSCLSGPDSDLQVFRSPDGGRTWLRQPATAARGQDHPTLLVASDGGLYAVSGGSARGSSGRIRSAIVVARSGDGGITFAEPVRVVASNLSYEAHNPAILSDGTLAIPFADHRRPGSRRRLQVQRDWLLLSTDRGKSFSEPMLISESCDARGGWSSLAVFRDTIYHVCTAQDLTGVQLRRTDNRGESWSDPIRIDSPGDVTPQTWAPAIAISQSGVIMIAWSDARNDRSTIKGNLRCKDIFVTASVDGGLTFAQEVRVSSKSSCPATPRNVEAALRFPAGGEYMGLAAAADGSFRLLWSDSRSEVYRLYTTSVTVQGK